MSVQWWRHLVNAYEVEADMMLFAGKLCTNALEVSPLELFTESASPSTNVRLNWTDYRRCINLHYLPTYLLYSAWRKYDDVLSRFGTIPERDKRTDRRTDIIVISVWRDKNQGQGKTPAGDRQPSSPRLCIILLQPLLELHTARSCDILKHDRYHNARKNAIDLWTPSLRIYCGHFDSGRCLTCN